MEAYVANLAAAQAAIGSGNYPEARTRLDACPESSAWEWKFLRKQAGCVIYSLPPGTVLHGFSKDGKRMLTESRDVVKGALPWMLHDGDGRWVSNKQVHRVLQTRDAVTGAPVGLPIRDTATFVKLAALSPNGTRVMTLGNEGFGLGTPDQFQIWNVNSGKPVGEPFLDEVDRPDDAFIPVAQLSPNGSWIAVAHGIQSTPHVASDEQYVVRIWNLPDGKQVGRAMEHPAEILSVAFSPDGSRLLTSCDDHAARLWNAGQGSLIGKPMKQGGAIDAIEFSPDGSRILVRSSTDSVNAAHEWVDGRTFVRVWDGFSGKPMSARMEPEPPDCRLERAERDIGMASCAPYVVQGVEVCPHSNLGRVAILGGVDRSVAAFSADGKRVLMGCYDLNGNTKIRVWDAETGLPVGAPVILEPSLQNISVIPGKDAFFTFDTTDPKHLEEIVGVSLWTFDGARIGKIDRSYTAARSPDGYLILLLRAR